MIGGLAVDPALDVEQHVDPLHRLQRQRRDRRRGLAASPPGRDVGELVELPPGMRPTRSLDDRSRRSPGRIEAVEGRTRDPPGPGAPACSCRAACRSRHSPARHGHGPEPGSSPPQNRKHPGQRRTVHLPVDHHTRAIGQRDLHPPRRRRSPREQRPLAAAPGKVPQPPQPVSTAA